MSERIKIGTRWVGDGEPTFIIAEIGSNHDRVLSQALKLINAAHAAGVDAVKFQLYHADDLYTHDAPVYGMVKATELPRDWIPGLAEYSRKLGLVFMASAFSVDAVDILQRVAVPAYKVASSDAVNLPLLKYIASHGRPILLSTGMCDIADIHEALEVINSEKNKAVVLLQCTSLYPTQPSDVHLRALDTLKRVFELPVGFSDHTMEVILPALSVVRGACVVEKHITLDKHLSGPDHNYALVAEEFKEMVRLVRIAESALGSSDKHMLDAEAKLARRESVHAARNIRAGEIITLDHIVIERPAGGLPTRFLKAIIGRRARVSIAQAESITWEKV